MSQREVTDALEHSGGVVIDGMVTRTCWATGETLLVPGRNERSKVGRITGDTGKVDRRREGVGRVGSSDEAG
jgi:hypothetical protein